MCGKGQRAGARVRFAAARPLLLASIILCAALAATAQAGEITLFGDFKVEGEPAAGYRAQSFQVALVTSGGVRVAQQPVTTSGRYRFNNLPPGEYVIVVELDGGEVARLPILISKGTKEYRQDIAMEWNNVAAPAAAAGTVKAPAYDRPPKGRALFTRAQEAAGAKDYERAAALYQELLDSDAKDFEAWTELGTVHFRQEKLDAAERDYRRALEVQHSYALALLNLGKVEVARKKFDAAVEPLARAVRLQPGSADANLYLGEAYLQLKKGSKAVPLLEEAARLGRPEARLRLAALYNAAGLKDRAAAEYEQFLAARPGYPERKRLEQYIKENKKQ